MNLFILDACALLAVLVMEKGAGNIRDLFQMTVDHQAVLMMNKFNFLEVYYKIYKSYGKIEADNLFNTMEQMPITLKDTLTNEVFKEAGRLKSTYKLSIADSIAVAETIIDLFRNPVGFFTSLAVFQAKALQNRIFKRKLFNN